jgi:non-heme chloroperoxidase
VPIAGSAPLAARLVRNSVLKVYPSGSHSLGDTCKEELNADLLAFVRLGAPRGLGLASPALG